MSNDKARRLEMVVSGALLLAVGVLMYHLGQTAAFLAMIATNFVLNVWNSRQKKEEVREQSERVVKLDFTASGNPLNRWSLTFNPEDENFTFTGPHNMGTSTPGMVLSCFRMLRETHGVDIVGRMAAVMSRDRHQYIVALGKYELLLTYARAAEKLYDARVQEQQGRVLPSYVEELEAKLPRAFSRDHWIPLPRRYPYDQAASPYDAIVMLRDMPADVVVDDIIEGDFAMDKAYGYETGGALDMGSFFVMVELRLVEATETRILLIREQLQRWTEIINVLDEEHGNRKTGE